MYKTDFSTCSATLIGVTPIFADIAVTPNGKLYSTDFYNLYEVNTTTAACSLIGEIDTMYAGFNSLVALNNDTLIGIRTDSGVYLISVTDGSKVLVGMLEHYPAGDITKFKGWYYMVDVLSQLVRFKMDLANNILHSVEVIGTMDTSFDEVYGILTVGSADCNEESTLRMLAFDGPDIYIVNEQTAAVSPICEDIGMFSAYGATSLVETQNQVYDPVINLPNVFTPNGDGVNDLFQPVNALGISELEVSVLNRWGGIVYACQATDIFSWDGSFDSKKCSEGVYYYILRYSDFCGNNEILLTSLKHTTNFL